MTAFTKAVIDRCYNEGLYDGENFYCRTTVSDGNGGTRQVRVKVSDEFFAKEIHPRVCFAIRYETDPKFRDECYLLARETWVSSLTKDRP